MFLTHFTNGETETQDFNNSIKATGVGGEPGLKSGSLCSELLVSTRPQMSVLRGVILTIA